MDKTAWKDKHQQFEEHQNWESNWWGNCLVTYWEELKQLQYAEKMEIKAVVVEGKYPFYDFKDAKTVIDIGGGPVSMLLKTLHPIKGTVVDPCDYPNWTIERYKEAGIEYVKQKAEDLDTTKVYDLTLIYNVLQHVDDPKKIIENARKVSKIIKIYEWVNTPPTIGHPHTLTKGNLDNWLGGIGQIGDISKNGCYGTYYAGTFKGDKYEI